MPFTGLAAYDDFTIAGEDVSDILRLISPTETPLLDLLPIAPRAATSVDHQWTEEQLGPDYITITGAINSATANTGVAVTSTNADLLQVGHLLELDMPTADGEAAGNQEVVQVLSIPGPNSLLLTRNFGSRGVNSLVAGSRLFVIATASQEGADSDADVSRARTRARNYTQIFKKPIKISGSRRAVITAPNIGDEFDHQVTQRTIELARDLEKAVIRSVASGQSIGADDQFRTMDGLRQFITTINSTVDAASFSASPINYINNLMQDAWDGGARDLDVLLVGHQWKREISGTNASSLQVTQDERGIERLVEFVVTDFANMRVVLTPWLPQRHLMGLATQRIFVPPLRTRSFQREAISKTGDSEKAHVVGEYTLECHHGDKMFQARSSG